MPMPASNFFSSLRFMISSLKLVWKIPIGKTDKNAATYRRNMTYFVVSHKMPNVKITYFSGVLPYRIKLNSTRDEYERC